MQDLFRKQPGVLHTRVGIGGGCHWCTEAVFQALRGVEKVEQGFIQSVPPHDDWSEAVIVHYDPDRITLETLIDAHLHSHGATSRHPLRNKYRSAIYTFTEQDAARAGEILQWAQAELDAPLLTRVLPFVAFRPSETRYVDYYRSDPGRPFCRRHIEPKLKALRQRLGERVA